MITITTGKYIFIIIGFFVAGYAVRVLQDIRDIKRLRKEMEEEIHGKINSRNK